MNRYFVGSILWALFILVLTLTPGASMPKYNLFTYDKLGHLTIFLVLAFLFISGLYENNSKSLSRIIIVGLILTTIYGAAIEIMQEFIPKRGMEIGDLLANCLGSIFGVLLFYIRLRKKIQ